MTINVGPVFNRPSERPVKNRPHKFRQEIMKQRPTSAVWRILAYVWALPVTLPALLLFVPLAYLSGGKARFVAGAVEIQGGLIKVFLRQLYISAAAMTLGHVILGRDQQCLDHSRAHEHVHIRQYERWGFLMLPIYFTASALLWLRGFDPYLDNPFEREAYGEDG